MKALLVLGMSLFIGSATAAADTGKVICQDDFLPDGNTFGGLSMALKKINAELSKMQVKTVSTPVFFSSSEPITVCVSITQ